MGLSYRNESEPYRQRKAAARALTSKGILRLQRGLGTRVLFIIAAFVAQTSEESVMT